MTINPNDCPFCGSPDIQVETDGNHHEIECNGCGVTGSVYDSREKAVEAWNRRATQPTAGEPVAYGPAPAQLQREFERYCGTGMVQNKASEYYSTPLYISPPAAAHGDEAVAFANELISGAWEGGDFCGADIQELAVKHGLLRVEQREEPCQEVGCTCAEYGFPTECYRKTEALAAMHAQAGEVKNG